MKPAYAFIREQVTAYRDRAEEYAAACAAGEGVDDPVGYRRRQASGLDYECGALDALDFVLGLLTPPTQRLSRQGRQE